MNAIEQQIAAVLPDVFDQVRSTTHPQVITANNLTTDTIPEGQRNAVLASLAGSMRRKDFSPEEIDAALQVANQRRCQPPLPAGEVESIAKSIARYPAQVIGADNLPLVGLTLDKLTEHVFPARKPIFVRGDSVVVREGHIVQTHAMRGFGKTFLYQSLALGAATGGEVLGFRAPEPRRVLYVDGEMAAEEINRGSRWSLNDCPCRRLRTSPSSRPTGRSSSSHGSTHPRGRRRSSRLLNPQM